MLVLTMRQGESVVIGHNMQFPCRVLMIGPRNGAYRLGFKADRRVKIHREILLQNGDCDGTPKPVD